MLVCIIKLGMWPNYYSDPEGWWWQLCTGALRMGALLPAWLPPVAGLARELPLREAVRVCGMAAAASSCEIQCVNY